MNEGDGAAEVLCFILPADTGTQWCHSTVLSDSSSESALLRVDSSSATEFLKGEMCVKSKIPSSSMSMMGMSKLQSESNRAESRD